jgi:hypothetical protein
LGIPGSAFSQSIGFSCSICNETHIVQVLAAVPNEKVSVSKYFCPRMGSRAAAEFKQSDLEVDARGAAQKEFFPPPRLLSFSILRRQFPLLGPLAGHAKRRKYLGRRLLWIQVFLGQKRAQRLPYRLSLDGIPKGELQADLTADLELVAARGLQKADLNDLYGFSYDHVVSLTRAYEKSASDALEEFFMMQLTLQPFEYTVVRRRIEQLTAAQDRYDKGETHSAEASRLRKQKFNDLCDALARVW